MVDTFNPQNPFNLAPNPLTQYISSTPQQSVSLAPSTGPIAPPSSASIQQTISDIKSGAIKLTPVSSSSQPNIKSTSSVPSAPKISLSTAPISLPASQPAAPKIIPLTTTSTGRGPGEYYNPLTKQGMSSLVDPGAGYIKQSPGTGFNAAQNILNSTTPGNYSKTFIKDVLINPSKYETLPSDLTSYMSSSGKVDLKAASADYKDIKTTYPFFNYVSSLQKNESLSNIQSDKDIMMKQILAQPNQTITNINVLNTLLSGLNTAMNKNVENKPIYHSQSTKDIINEANAVSRVTEKVLYDQTVKNSGKTIADFYKESKIPYPTYLRLDPVTNKYIPNYIHIEKGKESVIAAELQPGDKYVKYNGTIIPAFHAAVLEITTKVNPADKQLDAIKSKIDAIDAGPENTNTNQRQTLVDQYETLRVQRNDVVKEINSKYIPPQKPELKFPVIASIPFSIKQSGPMDLTKSYTPPYEPSTADVVGRIQRGPLQIIDYEKMLNTAKTDDERNAIQKQIEDMKLQERVNAIVAPENRYKALDLVRTDAEIKAYNASKNPLFKTGIEQVDVLQKDIQGLSTYGMEYYSGLGGLGGANVYAKEFKPDFVDYYPGSRAAYQTGRITAELAPYVALPILGPGAAAGGSAFGTGILSAEQVGAASLIYGAANVGRSKTPEEVIGNVGMAAGFSALGGFGKGVGAFGQMAETSAELAGKTSKYISPISKVVEFGIEKAAPIYFTGLAGLGGLEQVQLSAQGKVAEAQAGEVSTATAFGTMGVVSPFTNVLIGSPIESMVKSAGEVVYPNAVQRVEFWNKNLGTTMDMLEDKSGKYSVEQMVGPKKEKWVIHLLDDVGIKSNELPKSFKPLTPEEANQALAASLAGGPDMAKKTIFVKEQDAPGIRGKQGLTDMYFELPGQYTTSWFRDTATGELHGIALTGYISGKTTYGDNRGILDVLSGMKGPKGNQSLFSELTDYGGRIVQKTVGTAPEYYEMPSFNFFPDNRKYIIAAQTGDNKIKLQKVLDETTGRMRNMNLEEAVKISRDPKYSGQIIKAIGEYGFRTADGQVVKWDEGAGTAQAFRKESATEELPGGTVLREIPKSKQIIIGQSLGWEFLRNPYNYTPEKAPYKNPFDIKFNESKVESALPEFKKSVTREELIKQQKTEDITSYLKIKEQNPILGKVSDIYDATKLNIINIGPIVENPIIGASRRVIKTSDFIRNLPSIENIKFKPEVLLSNIQSLSSNTGQTVRNLSQVGLGLTDYLGYTAKNFTLTFKPVTIAAATWDDIKNEYGVEYMLVAKELARRNDELNRTATADEALVEYAAKKMKDPNFEPTSVQLRSIKTILQRELNRSLDPISLLGKRDSSGKVIDEGILQKVLKGKDVALTDLQKAKIDEILSTTADNIGNLSSLERKTLREVVSTKLSHPEKYNINDLTTAERATIDYFLKKDTMNARPDLFPDITPGEKRMAEAWLRKSTSKKLKTPQEYNERGLSLTPPEKGTVEYFLKQDVKAMQKGDELQIKYPRQVEPGTTRLREAARIIPERISDTGKKEYYMVLDAKSKTYGFSGGGTRKGESLETGGRREAFEETGGILVKMERDPSLDVFTGQFRVGRGLTQNLDKVFIAQFGKEPTITPGREISGGKWFTIDEIMSAPNVTNSAKQIVLKREGFSGESLALSPKLKPYLVKPELTDTFTPNFIIEPQKSIPRPGMEMRKEYIYGSSPEGMEKDIIDQLKIEESNPKEKMTSSQKAMLSDIASQLSLPKEFKYYSEPSKRLDSSEKAIFSDIISQISSISSPSKISEKSSISDKSSISEKSSISSSSPSYSPRSTPSSGSSGGSYIPGHYTPPQMGGPVRLKGPAEGKPGKKKGLIQVKSSLFRKFAFGEKDLLITPESLVAFKSTLAKKGSFFGYDVVPTREQIKREEEKLLKSQKEKEGLKETSFLDIRV